MSFTNCSHKVNNYLRKDTISSRNLSYLCSRAGPYFAWFCHCFPWLLLPQNLFHFFSPCKLRSAGKIGQSLSRWYFYAQRELLSRINCCKRILVLSNILCVLYYKVILNNYNNIRIIINNIE